jgi:hypothetical protein
MLEVKIIEGTGCGTGNNMIQATLLDFTKNRIEKTLQTAAHKVADPQFNHTFTFGEDYEFHDDVPPTLCLELLDKGYFQTDTRGLVTIKTDDIPNELPYKPVTKDYKFKPKKLAFKGGKGDWNRKADKSVGGNVKVKVQLQWKLPEGETGEVAVANVGEFEEAFVDERDMEMSPNLLLVRVISASKLRIMDSSSAGGSADPRVTILIDGKKVKCLDGTEAISSIKTRKLQPVWNETFMIPYMPEADGSAPLMEFEVHDHDKGYISGSMFEFMGKTSYSLQTAFHRDFEVKEEKLKDSNGNSSSEKPRGFLQFAAQWINDPGVVEAQMVNNEKKGGGFFSVFAEKEDEIEDLEEEEDAGGRPKNRGRGEEGKGGARGGQEEERGAAAVRDQVWRLSGPGAHY